jgi:hypothetical protein
MFNDVAPDRRGRGCGAYSAKSSNQPPWGMEEQGGSRPAALASSVSLPASMSASASAEAAQIEAEAVELAGLRREIEEMGLVLGEDAASGGGSSSSPQHPAFPMSSARSGRLQPPAAPTPPPALPFSSRFRNAGGANESVPAHSTARSAAVGPPGGSARSPLVQAGMRMQEQQQQQQQQQQRAAPTPASANADDEAALAASAAELAKLRREIQQMELALGEPEPVGASAAPDAAQAHGGCGGCGGNGYGVTPRGAQGQGQGPRPGQGHRHNSGAATQNVGNAIGDRSSIRQSQTFRM